MSSTGVAGLTLGGGFGFLKGKCGLTIDCLRSVELVTAGGDVLCASEAENEDLFWGLRGGGGNFGIATSFEFDLHAIGPMVHGGMIAYPFEAARDMLAFLRDLNASASDDLTIVGGLTHTRDGSGTKLGALVSCHCGTAGDASATLERIRTFGTPAMDGLGQISFSAVNQIFDEGVPKLDLYYWKSCFVERLSDEVIEILWDRFACCPSDKTKIFIEYFHGAAVRPDPSAMAYPHRTEGYSILIVTQWTDPADNERNIEWARETYGQLMQHARESAYTNYMDDDESLARVKQAFGDNFPRLQKLKDRL